MKFWLQRLGPVFYAVIGAAWIASGAYLLATGSTIDRTTLGGMATIGLGAVFVFAAYRRYRRLPRYHVRLERRN